LRLRGVDEVADQADRRWWLTNGQSRAG
jgi:hypothetical protein